MGRGRRGFFDDLIRLLWPVALAVGVIIAVLPDVARACLSSPTLHGALTIPQCDPRARAADCTPAAEVLHQRLEAFDIPDVFTIGLQSSPWRMYDADARILTVEDVANGVRASRPESDRRVHLIGSWTAARPDGSTDTLAHRLSSALDGLPVDGSDGFLWLDQNGNMRTTRQAASLRITGPYAVHETDDVMMALIPGALIDYEAGLDEQGNAEGLVHVGMGYDAFLLCPERALAAFERAAELGSAIGAYNAGLIHAEAGRRADATAWLRRAVALGDQRARPALDRIIESARRE